MINDPDTGLILLAAMRYCLGRRTYMPSVFVAYIMRHSELLDERTVALMIRDIEEQRDWYKGKPDLLEKYGNPLGDPCDVREWMKLLEWLKRIEKSEQYGHKD